MKTKLFTKKLYLGLLITFVLALGVQGVVEAVTTRIRSGSFQLKKIDEEFTISFTISDIDDGDTLEIPNTTDITLKKIGSAVIPSTAGTITLYDADTHESYQRLRSGSLSLTYEVGSIGAKDITVGDATITVYIAPEHDDTSTIALVGDGLDFSIGEERIDDDFSGLTSVRVNYTVSGSGSVYVKKDDTKGSGSKNLITSSDAPVYLDMRGSTNTVTASVVGQRAARAVSVTYIYSHAILTKESGDKQKGAVSARLAKPLVVKVVDGRTRPSPVSGVEISFTATDSGSFLRDPSFPSNLYVPETGTLTGVKTNSSGLANIFWVLGSTADADQTATATLTGSTTIQANTIGFTATFGTTTSEARSIVIESGDGQSVDKFGLLEDPLVVVVRDQRGQRVNEAKVTFLARDGGTLNIPSEDEPGSFVTGDTDTDTIKEITTNASGQASVRYTPPESGGRRTVSASISGGLKSVVFTVSGGGSGDDDPPATITRALDIDVSGTGSTRTVRVTALQNGISQTGINVTLTVSGAASLSGASSGGTPLERTLTLPSTAGTYTLRASTTASGYSAVTEDVTVTLPGTLGITLVGNQVNGAQTIQVTARNAAGSLETTAVTVTLSGAGISRTVPVTGSQNVPITLPTTSGTLTASATGYRSGSVTLPARSTGSTQQQQQQQQTARTASRVQIRSDAFPRGTVNTRLAQPLSVRVVDANGNGVSNVRVTFEVTSGQGRLSQRGNGRAIRVPTNSRGEASAPYTPLGASSQVRATAAGVSQTVAFTISTGSAPPTAAATGTTRAARQYKVRDTIPISLESTLTFSDSRTISGTIYTCVSPGECVVSHGVVVKGEIRSEVSKPDAQYKVRDKIPVSLEDTLTFRGRHTVNGTIYTCVGPGECVVSYGVVVKGQIRSAAQKPGTPAASGTIDPEVLVAAAQRAPMLWIDGGKIYALVGGDVQEFVAGVENAYKIAIAGDKVYWTEQTGERGGSIKSANLDGTGVAEITNILATPTGIAVDTEARRIYVTNLGGRILRMNLDGSGIQTVRHNLLNPEDIAVSGGNAYWTEVNGGVRFVPLSGTQDVRNISTGRDASTGNLVIAGGKVYWTEMAGKWSPVSGGEAFNPAGGGRIKSANLNGTGATQVASILASPTGIAIDTARSKIYVTNTGGRILRMNLDGSFIQTVVDGLGRPGDMVLSNSLKAPAVPTPAKTASTPNYDVDGSGTVDNTDLFLVTLAVGTTNTQYDVNKDGKVDDKDIVLVRENRDNGAAAAPMILGVKLTAEQVDRLQAQIDLLVATNDRSPATIRTLLYLQQLLATGTRPEKTQLLANYPNPFNPETWIPYELATDTDVRITIYDARGVVIRTLQLGQQSAGYYTDRERAAYWDGRNALGEQVASGVYFYQFETDTMSSMRKMVILK